MYKIKTRPTLLLAISYLLLSLFLYHILYFPVPTIHNPLHYSLYPKLIIEDIVSLLFYIVSAVFFIFNIYLISFYKNSTIEPQHGGVNKQLLKQSTSVFMAINLVWIIFILIATDPFFVVFLLRTPFFLLILILVFIFSKIIVKLSKGYFLNIVTIGTLLLMILQIAFISSAIIMEKKMQKEQVVRFLGIWKLGGRW